MSDSGRDERGRWKPGITGNPFGGAAHIQTWKGKNRKEIAKLIDKLTSMTDDQFKEFITRPEATKLERMIGSAIQNAENGNTSAWDAIMTRMIGKPIDEVEVSTPKPTLVRLPGGDKMIMGVTHQNDDDGDTEK